MAEPTPEVAVGGVLVSDGRLLLVRRARGVAAGLWSLPGGRMEPGESLREALVREMAEETVLDVEVGKLCGVSEVRAEGAHYVILDYWCTARDASAAVAADDAAALTWADRGDLERLPLVAGLADFLAEHRVLEALR